MRFTLNGTKIDLDAPPMKRLLDVLREECGLPGTKEGCGEGECGACSVTIDGTVANACLVPFGQVRGARVRTIEGFGGSHPLQAAFIACGAAQCGICTPGMIIAASAIPKGASRERVREALAGNLCRCTGYEAIYRAVEVAAGSRQRRVQPAPVRCVRKEPAEGGVPAFTVFQPTSRDEALRMLRDEGPLMPVAGCTDVFVALQFGTLPARRFLDLWGVDELARIRVEDGMLVIGARATWTDIIRSRLVRQRLPILAEAARQIGGVQIQNRGTIGGNVGNASPAGDSLPVLMAAGAVIVLDSARGERRVPYEDFQTGYRRTVMNTDEIITAIEVPKAPKAQWFRKVGTRAAQAISKVVIAAVGDEVPRLAVGSVADRVLRLFRTEEALSRGVTIADAQRVMLEEISPIDDVRSTADYRRQVCANLLGRWAHENAKARRARPGVPTP